MASLEKFNNTAVCNILRHNQRFTLNSSNKDIDPERTKLNYSFPMEHNGLSDYKYYKQLLGETYMYGRGTKREEAAVTACGWVITLPQELYGFPEKEKAFFKGCFEFCKNRYSGAVINNSVHYDEAGLPHIHIVFCPITELNHDIVQHKTTRTKQYIRLDSGRYEPKFNFRLDEHGEKIKLKNYAKITDYYDKKIDSNTVVNKAELKHFGPDLQKYLNDNDIEGTVVTGSTSSLGVNFTVKELKEFTAKTGLTINEVKEMVHGKTLVESFVEKNEKVHELENQIRDMDVSFREKFNELQKHLSEKEHELKKAHEKIKELEMSQVERNNAWGRDHSSGWGSNTKTIEKERIW